MKKVFIARRQTNTCDGNGPMAPVLAFEVRKDAENFIDGKPGVQGLVRDWSQMEYGEWDIHELVLIGPGETVTREALASNTSENTIEYIEKYSRK